MTTLSELKADKLYIESQITKLLKEFSLKHGVYVSDIDCDRIDTFAGPNTDYIIRLEVNL